MITATSTQQEQAKIKQRTQTQSSKSTQQLKEEEGKTGLKTKLSHGEQKQPGATSGLALKQTTQAMKDIDLGQEVLYDSHLTERINQVR